MKCELPTYALRRRRIIFITGLAVFVCLGLIYAWSIFIEPLESEFGWVRTQTSMTFTVSMCCFCLGSFAGSFLSRRCGPRPAMLAAAVLLFGGFAGASAVESFPAFCACYGIGCGGGVGLAYNVLLNAINKWFPDKQGVISGVSLMGFGFGGMLLGTAASKVIGAFGWRFAFMALGVLFGVVVAGCALTLCLPGEDIVFPAGKSRKVSCAPYDLRPKQMLRIPAFYYFFLWTTAIANCGLMIMGNAAAIAAELGASADAAVLLAGSVSVANGLGRVFYGLMYDKRGRSYTMSCANGVFLLSGALLVLTFVLRSPAVLCAAFLCMGLCNGAVPPVNSVYMQEFYGAKYFGENLSMANLNMFLNSTLSLPLAAAIQTATGSYRSAMYIVPVFAVLAFLLQRGVRPPDEATVARLLEERDA